MKPYVVNVTLPDRAEDYIHRVGRVGAMEAPKREFKNLGHNLIYTGHPGCS